MQARVYLPHMFINKIQNKNDESTYDKYVHAPGDRLLLLYCSKRSTRFNTCCTYIIVLHSSRQAPITRLPSD